MRILFSTDQVYLHGGIEKVMAQKANYFADVLGYDVAILTTEQKGKSPRYLLSPKIELIDIGIEYVRSKSYFHPVNLAKIPKHFSASKKAMHDWKPDFVISSNYAFDFYWLPYVCGKAAKIKEYHSSRYYYNQAKLNAGVMSRLRFAIDDFFASKFDRLIVLNPDEKPFYKGTISVIPNPIELSELHAPLLSKRIIAAGRIAPIKAFDVLIETWKQTSEKLPGWQLDIYGDGEPGYIAQLNDLINRLGLTKTVTIHRATANLQQELVQSSFYAMTSVSECFPMVLLESAAIGLPAISFDCPTGPRHIVIDGETGMIVPDKDANAFSEKMVTLATDNAMRIALGKNAKQQAERFSTNSVMKQWVSLFNSIHKK